MSPEPSTAPRSGSGAPATKPAAAAVPASASPLASASSIPTAVSVGWLLAELSAEIGELVANRLPDGSLSAASLPGSAASLLVAVPPVGVRVRQIQVRLSRLKADLNQAGVPAEDSATLDAKLETLAMATRGTADGASGNGNTPRPGLGSLVGEVTQDALANLTAASTRLGRALSLGYDLAKTCTLSHGAGQDEFVRLFGLRVVEVQEALADLASFLPEHAGRSVSLSLAQWQYWAMDPKLSKHALIWPQEGVEDALARQGQVWRAVLTGEKLGKDMLAVNDYFGALSTLVRRFLKRPWIWAALLVAVAALGGGLYVFVTQPNGLARIGGAFLSAAGAVGISTASLKRALSDVGKEIEAQVWGAEMDYAIAEAVTVPPGDWRVTLKKIDTPPPRGRDPHIAANARTVHRLALAIGRGKPRPVRRVQKYIHENGEYQTLNALIVAKGGKRKPAVLKRRGIARRLIKKAPWLGFEPERVAAGAPYRLVSAHRDPRTEEVRAFVWTFRGVRVRHIQEFDRYDAAYAASHLPSPLKGANPVPSADAGPMPPPVRHAADRQKLRKAEEQVRVRLTPEHRQLADRLTSRTDRLALRALRRQKGSPDVFMPRNAYLSLVQNALERRLEFHRLNGPPPKGGAGAREAADGSSLDVGDELFDRFGPDDFGWMKTVVEAGLTALDGSKHPFGTTPTEQRLDDRALIVLLADWGTGTPRARRIAELARRRLDTAADVDRHVIHLGDVYYCGLPGEYRSRFLDDWPVRADAQTKKPVTSWNLNGNHDMYCGGQGYFEVIHEPPFAQQAGTSCFRLLNDHWQFIALDTAYADNDLYDAQLPWLERWVEQFGDKNQRGERRRTVLLSHHQLGSAKAQKSVGPGIHQKTEKVRETGRIHAWFWGHEHRCFLYEPYEQVTCPVCLGNGGVPELLSPQLTLTGAFGWFTSLISNLTGRPKPLVPAPTLLPEVDQPGQADTDSAGLRWAKLGFVVLSIEGNRGSAAYVDEDGNEVPITQFAVPA